MGPASGEPSRHRRRQPPPPFDALTKRSPPAARHLSCGTFHRNVTNRYVIVSAMYAESVYSGVRLARIGLLVVIVAILTTIVAFVASGPSRRVPPVSVAVLPNGGDSGLHEFSFVQNKDGLVDWKIHAKQARMSETEAKAVLTDVTVTLTGRDGVSMTVEGDEGTINTASKDFVIGRRSGDLAVVLQDGFTIYTPHIAWANEEHRLWTDDAVRITGPRLEIVGQGMDTLLPNREMRVRRDVHVEVR